MLTVAEKVLVAGGGFLGVNVALGLASEKEVVLVDEDLSHVFVPGLVDVLRGRFSVDSLTLDLKDFMDGCGVELVEGRVREVDAGEKKLILDDRVLGYDSLVLGLGGRVRSFGVDISDAFDVWNVEGVERLKSEMDKAESCVVVGSGYLGVEVAGELAETGVSTTVVEAAERPMPQLSRSASGSVLETLNSLDVDFLGGREVVEIDGGKVFFRSGESIEADIAVWCGGVEASYVVQDSLDADASGLEVDKRLRSVEHEDIFAGGDNADTGEKKTAHNAMEQADVIVENLLGGEKKISGSKAPLIASVGDTGFIVQGGRILWNGFPSRRLKDLVRVFYIARLKWRRLVQCRVPSLTRSS